MNDRPYRATALIVEDFYIDGKNIMFDMDLTFGAFKTDAHAEKVSDLVESVVFLIEDDVPKVHISEKHGTQHIDYYLYDKDIDFRKVKDKKQESMGKPIDCSKKEGAEKAIKVLTEMDKSYLITEDDLEPFDFSLEEMKKHFKHGYHLQHVACGTKKIDK